MRLFKEAIVVCREAVGTWADGEVTSFSDGVAWAMGRWLFARQMTRVLQRHGNVNGLL